MKSGLSSETVALSSAPFTGLAAERLRPAVYGGFVCLQRVLRPVHQRFFSSH
jgi:hypothetical protein